MKNFKIVFFFLTIMVTGAFISSFGNANHGHDHSMHGEGKAFTSTYVCSMHCDGSGSEAEGKCPVRGMDYVTQKEHVKDGHKHSGSAKKNKTLRGSNTLVVHLFLISKIITGF